MDIRNLSTEEKIALLENKDYNPEQTIVFLSDRDVVYTIEPIQEGDYKLGVEEYTEDQKKSIHRSLRVEEGDDFKLQRGAILDLSKPVDVVKWNWVKHYMDKFFVLGKDALSPGNTAPKFYISVEEQEHKTSLKSSEDKFKAMKLVFETSTDDLVKYAKLNGTPMKGAKPEILRDMLAKLAESNPAKLIALYTEPKMITKFLLIELLESNILNYSETTSTYLFNNKLYAIGEEDCLEKLVDKKNKDTEAIRKRFEEYKINKA
jgi:hypothetical protein